MFFLPIDKMEITTHKTPPQVKQTLDDSIATSGIQNVRFWNKRLVKGKLFEGDTTDDSFILRRIIKYWNICLPIIKGSVEKSDDKTKINIKLRMTVLDEIVYAILFVGLIISALTFVFPAVALTLLGKVELVSIFALGIIVMTALYKSEVKKTKSVFEEMFGEKPEEK